MGYVIDVLTSSPPTHIINAKGEGLLSPREEQVVNLRRRRDWQREVALIELAPHGCMAQQLQFYSLPG